MLLEIIFYGREEDSFPLVEKELRDLAALSKSGKKDEARLRAVMEKCWAVMGFNCTQLNFRPIEGKPYEKKLWEARYLRTARSDGVHGYRIFYRVARNPNTNREVAIVLMLFAKEGHTTPTSVLDEAWTRYMEVDELLARKCFF